MNRSRRLEFWVSGTLGVVCLLLLNILARELQKEPTRKFVVAGPARSVFVAEDPPTSSRAQLEPRHIKAGGSSNAATKSRQQLLDRVVRRPFASEQPKRIVTMPPAEAHPQAVTPRQPKTITLEPLGYVQKADGRVEAIISLGEHVQVVHEGEIFEDKFRVAKLSSSSVELVENSATAAEAQVTAEVGQGVAQAPAGKVPQMPTRPVPEVASNADANRQFSADSSDTGSQPSVSQELGYVERADGRVEAIVAEGEHVRLAQATKSFARNFHVPAPSPANLEMANALPPAINPADSLGQEIQPPRNSSTEEAGGPPLIALGSEPSTMDKPQGIPVSDEESESEPPGIVEPEPMADYSASRFQPRDAASVLHAGPAGAALSRATAGSGEALKGGATPPLPSDGRGTRSAVNTLGYVEKAGGEKEAIVEVLGRVYLVHEGELFAEKYRALQVTPSSVKIVEESTEASSRPAEPERDSEAVRPPISRLRAPPLSTGSSGTDRPVEVRKAQE